MTQKDIFWDKYIIVPEIVKPAPKIQAVLDNLKTTFDIEISTIEELNNIGLKELETVFENCDFYNKSKFDTKLNKFIDEVTNYLEFKNTLGNKIPILKEEFEQIYMGEQALISAPFAESFITIEENIPNIEILYQAKFTCNDPVLGELKCMFDKLIVNHDTKKIRPIDYKTTSDLEINFPKAVKKFKYYIQAELYFYVLDSVLQKSKEFSNYSYEPFTFIVINLDNLSPICWEYPIENIHSDWFRAVNDIRSHYETNQFKYYPSILNKKAILTLPITME